MRDNLPLVSIIIITYNSMEYVVQTLDSAKGQSYSNLELIVSDDCSTDDTINVVKNWVSGNRDRFRHVIVNTSAVNTGIPVNCNRGARAATGKWIKLIAGDDVLVSNCIESNIAFAQANPAARFIFSKVNVLMNGRVTNDFIYHDFFFQLAEKQQLRALLFSNPIFAVTSFVERDVLAQLNFYDEKYLWMEDYPLWVKASYTGHRLYGFDEVTCLYRVHENNISLDKTKIYPTRVLKDVRRFYWSRLFKISLSLLFLPGILYNVLFFFTSSAVLLNGNNNTGVNNFLVRLNSLVYKSMIGLTINKSRHTPS
jgi:alpha-1,3-rhamnosyltransferase